jgi:hypothetical protein
VKTISILKIFSVAVNIVLLLVIAFIGYKLFAIDKYLPMNCMSSFYINQGEKNGSQVMLKLFFI